MYEKNQLQTLKNLLNLLIYKKVTNVKKGKKFRKVKILTSTFRLCSCIPSPLGLVPFTNLPPDSVLTSERKRKTILLTYAGLEI